MSSKRPSAATTGERIGVKLKELREQAGLSLRTLAERAGFSASFISQIENGDVSASIASLEKIAATLNASIVDFFATPPTSAVSVIRADARPSFRSSWSRAHVEALAPVAGPEGLEALLISLEPGGSSGKKATGSPSAQFAFVLEGRFILTTHEASVALGPGDAVVVPAAEPQRWQNKGAKSARVLLVSARARR